MNYLTFPKSLNNEAIVHTSSKTKSRDIQIIQIILKLCYEYDIQAYNKQSTSFTVRPFFMSHALKINFIYYWNQESENQALLTFCMKHLML